MLLNYDKHLYLFWKTFCTKIWFFRNIFWIIYVNSIFCKLAKSFDINYFSLILKILEVCQGFQGEKSIEIKSLIETLFFQLSLGSKLPPRGIKISSNLTFYNVFLHFVLLFYCICLFLVKEEILCLIGMAAHYYPQDFIPYQERVLSMFLQELKTQVFVF